MIGTNSEEVIKELLVGGFMIVDLGNPASNIRRESSLLKLGLLESEQLSTNYRIGWIIRYSNSTRTKVMDTY